MTASEPVRIADAAWLTSGALGKLMAVLDDDGEEARVVGGAVRNILIGEPTGEIDLATTALPEISVNAAAAAATAIQFRRTNFRPIYHALEVRAFTGLPPRKLSRSPPISKTEP